MAFELGPAGYRGFYGPVDVKRKKKSRQVRALAMTGRQRINAIKILR